MKLPTCTDPSGKHRWVIYGDTNRGFPTHTYRGNLYRACNRCRYRDPDFQPCEHEVANGWGWSNCTHRAVVQDPDQYHDEQTVWHCGVHSNATRDARNAKTTARWAAESAERNARWKREQQGRDLLPLVGELLRFVDANPDLTEDEWLAKIVRQIREVLA